MFQKETRGEVGGGKAMKFVLIPDSFKGTLSSIQICKIAAEKI